MNAPAELLKATELAPSLKILLVMTILGLLPAILLTTTSSAVSRTSMLRFFEGGKVGLCGMPVHGHARDVCMFLAQAHSFCDRHLSHAR